jgi:hypothetical protein
MRITYDHLNSSYNIVVPYDDICNTTHGNAVSNFIELGWKIIENGDLPLFSANRELINGVGFLENDNDVGMPDKWLYMR